MVGRLHKNFSLTFEPNAHAPEDTRLKSGHLAVELNSERPDRPMARQLEENRCVYDEGISV